MRNKYDKLKLEIQELRDSNELTNDGIIDLFKKYEISNLNHIKKLNKRRSFEHNRIKGGLRQTINAHGPITKELIPSATKRISGALITNENIIPKVNLNSFIWGLIIGSLIIILLV